MAGPDAFPDNLLSSVVYFPSVPYPENKDVLTQDGENDPVVADPEFSESGERPLENGILVGTGCEILLNLILVEADDDVIIYHNDRDSSLAGQLHHLLELASILGDIEVRELDSFFYQVFLRHPAPRAGRRRVNLHILFSHIITLYHCTQNRACANHYC